MPSPTQSHQISVVHIAQNHNHSGQHPLFLDPREENLDMLGEKKKKKQVENKMEETSVRATDEGSLCYRCCMCGTEQ